MDVVVAGIGILLALVIGFAVHRASLCNVMAVAEVLSSRRAHMLGSFLKSVLWVVAATAVIELLFLSEPTQVATHWGFSGQALAGGFVFGVGAAVNGGCALGTLGRLGNGELRMVITLLGLAVGLAGSGFAQMTRWLPANEAGGLGLSLHPSFGIALSLLLGLWALSELRRLWKGREPGSSVRTLVASSRYRLSTAALLLGVANAVLYALFGPWTYTRTARVTVNQLFVGGPGPGAFYWILFAALVAGVVISGLARRSFVLDWRVRLSWLRNLLGGVLMGVGVTLTPGGNDALILHAIPGGSPHALPAYGALLVGTAAGLVVIRRVAGAGIKVQCTGDVCRTHTAPTD